MLTDEELYKDVCRGSQAAFAELYARYESPLFGFIFRRTGSREDAEEIFQDVMLALLKTPTLTLARGGLAAWLYKTAVNASLNRRRSERRAAAGKKLLEYERNLVSCSEADLIAAEQQQQVARAAEKLSPALRDVYELRKAGKSYEEAASTLILPIGSVKSRINAMVHELRKGVKKWIVK